MTVGIVSGAILQMESGLPLVKPFKPAIVAGFGIAVVLSTCPDAGDATLWKGVGLWHVLKLGWDRLYGYQIGFP